jgi:hypothetical protein
MLDMHSMGIALRVHWLWLQRVDPDRPWLTMPSNEDMVTRVFFQTSMQWEIVNGESIII